MAAATASVDWAGTGLGSDNGPILYSEPNRTSAIDDIRSVVIYIFIVTIFLSFFLILPGIRNDKFPTFLCITSSLIVTSIILISLFGTTWHVGEAPISAAYKAFSRDRIQGHLSVKIGLQSVNITLRAHKYYILHSTHGPIIMDNSDMPLTTSATSALPTTTTTTASTTTTPSAASNLFAQPEVGEASSFISPTQLPTSSRRPGLGDELLRGRTADGVPIDTELEVEEVFDDESSARRRRSSSNHTAANKSRRSIQAKRPQVSTATTFKQQKYTIKRLNVDINYNERFYWIGPSQMRQEHHNALERGLPYPILTVVEYLSQDEAGFSWSRQYRLAGYYSYIILWLSLCVCVLMFFLHCAAPKYGIYTMQALGCLLLFTNFTYATLVPRGDQKLIIPFEGQPLTFEFGWNFWLILIGGCLSLFVGTVIVLLDCLFPNFIFTTILDVDFDSHSNYFKGPRALKDTQRGQSLTLERPSKPAFLRHQSRADSREGYSTSSPQTSTSSKSSMSPKQADLPKFSRISARHRYNSERAQLGELFAGPPTINEASNVLQVSKGDIIERAAQEASDDVFSKTTHKATSVAPRKSVNLKSMDQRAATKTSHIPNTSGDSRNVGRYEEEAEQVVQRL